jgi:hypothetical protein
MEEFSYDRRLEEFMNIAGYFTCCLSNAKKEEEAPKT